MLNTAINEPDAIITSYYPIWKRNRDIIDGTRSVRANATAYIPQAVGQCKADYLNYVSRIPFYPAAARTFEGLMGLIFRKPANVVAPDSVADILDTITAAGFNLDDLAEEVMAELLITNYGALVTDYPITPRGMSKAKAIELGYRPFVALYKAESVLGVPETRVINNRQRIVRLRLMDDVDTIRELRLDDGVYSITIHRNNAGNWTADEPIFPTKGGKSLDEIPVTMVTTSRNFQPTKAPLSAVVELNADHYLASADYATQRYFSTVRIFEIKGVGKDTDIVDNAPVYPGARWTFEKVEVATKIMGVTDNTLAELREAMLDIETKMAAVGSRILVGDKNAAEAAETLRVRDNASHATLSTLSRVKDRKINDQLAWVSWWMDLEEDAISYECNTDYAAAPMSSQDITARVGLFQAGVIALDTLQGILVATDVLPETFDAEVEATKIAEAIDAAPPVDAEPEEEDPETDK